ncbi:MAG: HlyC/CorC family transporter, partial [Chloroflexi bacterium]|nr:HlyC/CorC family transporter [Chloroflexota bacterium]
MEPPSWPTIGEWIGLAAFLLLTALSSCAETALMAASRLRLHHLRQEGVSRARAIESVLAHPDILASTIHLLSLIGTVGATTMIIAVMWRLNQATWSMVVAAVLAFFLVLILGQIVPRVVAVQNPDAAALIFARPIELLAQLFSPFIQAIATMTRVLLRLLGVRQQLAAPLVTEEQLRLLANAADDIEDNEREMIDGIFELEETLAREVMVPRVDIVAVPADCAAGAAVDVVLDRGRTRLPVYEESLDHILGVVHAHSLFRALRSGQPETSVRDLMHPVYFIPDSKRVDDLLSEMQLKKIHLAIVVDEYGGTAGL